MRRRAATRPSRAGASEPSSRIAHGVDRGRNLSLVMAVGSRPLVPSRLAPGGALQRAHGTKRTPRTVVGAYVALTKPRIIELLLITTIPTMVLADRGWPSWTLMLWTLVGGTLAAGGANAINMYVDRDIDALMKRTQDRPLVTGVIEPQPRPGVRPRPRGRSPSPSCGGAPTCCRPCSRCRRRRSTSASTRCG